ncbi:unnamed protein product [Closterium sp. NIES-64]|nr:unnamed protein product [Closterium sp. NIES-64]
MACGVEIYMRCVRGESGGEGVLKKWGLKEGEVKEGEEKEGEVKEREEKEGEVNEGGLKIWQGLPKAGLLMELAEARGDALELRGEF